MPASVHRIRNPTYDQVSMADRFPKKTKPPKFSAAQSLRRAGFTARARADAAAQAAPAAAARAARRSGAVPELGVSRTSVGGLLVYAFLTIVALALLENALGGRGPATVAKVLDALGTGITKLVSPNDPLVPRGTVPGAAGATAARGGAASAAFGTATYTSSPTKVDGVSFVGSLVGVKVGFVQALAAAARASGATAVKVISGRRSRATNSAAGGVEDSNHLTGDAIDAQAYVNGKWVPIGTLSTLAAYGIRSGNQPGFFNGRPDPNHVDTAANTK